MDFFFKYMPVEECLPIILVGFSIVFLILLFLVIFFAVLGKIVTAFNKDGKDGGNDKKKN